MKNAFLLFCSFIAYASFSLAASETTYLQDVLKQLSHGEKYSSDDNLADFGNASVYEKKGHQLKDNFGLSLTRLDQLSGTARVSVGLNDAAANQGIILINLSAAGEQNALNPKAYQIALPFMASAGKMTRKGPVTVIEYDTQTKHLDSYYVDKFSVHFENGSLSGIEIPMRVVRKLHESTMFLKLHQPGQYSILRNTGVTH